MVSQKENEPTLAGEEEEIGFSTQDMINDARTRRELRDRPLQCDHCEYKTRSATMMQTHIKTHQKDDEEEEISFSSQDMIYDARSKHL